MISDEPLPRGALSGKVAVVVGGASGIGRTAAKALARQGARIVIADIDSERMERTVDEILHLGTSESALALTTDLRNDSSVRSMAEDALKAMGRVDVLINVAGVFLQGPLEKTKTTDWRWVLETNLLGIVRTAMAFAPHMVERGSGDIVNATSTPATSLTIPYDTCTVAVAHFTSALAEELAPRGVHVFLLSIGAGGPRIGQNTRSRGMGRVLHPKDDLEEAPASDGQTIDALLEMLRR